MDGLFIEYRDPLLGIIIFVALIFIAGLFSYFWGLFKHTSDETDLSRFLERFSLEKSNQELDVLLDNPHVPFQAMMILATSYEKKGDYEQAIRIYQRQLEHLEHPSFKKELLLKIAINYFHAGFLERSKETLLALLRTQPRVPEALHYLMLIYEKMHLYTKAIEIIEPLEILEVDIRLEWEYLQILSVIYNKHDSIDEKRTKLLELYRSHGHHTRMIIEFFVLYFPHETLGLVQSESIHKVVDLLWGLPKEHIDFAILSSIPYLEELYSAKGYIASVQSSQTFELEMLIKLHAMDYEGATLQFEYLCDSCKQLFPVSFHRCPSCLKVDTITCESVLTRSSHEIYYTF